MDPPGEAALREAEGDRLGATMVSYLSFLNGLTTSSDEVIDIGEATLLSRHTRQHGSGTKQTHR